jgi:hypothetical protein
LIGTGSWRDMFVDRLICVTRGEWTGTQIDPGWTNPPRIWAALIAAMPAVEAEEHRVMGGRQTMSSAVIESVGVAPDTPENARLRAYLRTATRVGVRPSDRLAESDGLAGVVANHTLDTAAEQASSARLSA